MTKPPKIMREWVLEAKDLGSEAVQENPRTGARRFSGSGITDDEMAALVEKARDDFQPVSDE